MKVIAVVATENDTALAIVHMDADEVQRNAWEPFMGELSEQDWKQMRLLIGFVHLDDEPG